MKPKIAIIVGTKGRGSNMANLIDACRGGSLAAEIGVVIAPSAASPALERAKALGVPTQAIPYGEGFGPAVIEACAGCELVCLAGFMRLLPSEVLAAFPKKIINVHPALLPKFGGKGMYGRHVHEAVLAAGETKSGASVHYVTEEYDEGAVVLQMECPVEPGDTPETLAERVLAVEHEVYPRAVALLIANEADGTRHPARQGTNSSAAGGTSNPAGPTLSGAHLQHPFFQAVGLPLAKFVSWVILMLCGPFRACGRANIPRTGGLLILSNHLADVDPIAVQVACPRPIYFMAKSELFSWPILGRILRMFRAFPVKRGAPDRQSLRKAAETAKAGHVVCVFPEGELSETGELIPLKPGAGLIVKLAGVPVICCGLRNTNRVMPYGKVFPRPAFRWVTAAWGTPREFPRDTEAEEIVAWAEGELRRLTGQADL